MQCSTSRAAEAAAQLRPRSRVPHARAAAPGSRRRGVASVRPTASSNAQASPQLASAATVVRLGITPLTPENFRPFGQVVGTTEDGKVYDSEDAQLVLDRGTPRFYVMRLPSRGLKFHRITYHGQVTQCLGGLLPVQDWFMAVAAPSGSVERYPQPDDIRVFRVPHGTYLKLEVGTWHAGPLFDGSPTMDFYNLELKDTNVVDHNTHDYRKSNNLEFELVV